MNERMQIGIRSASVNAGESFGETEVLILKQLGFEHIELNFNRVPLYNNLSDNTCAVLRRLGKKHRVRWSAHASDDINLSSPEPQVNVHGVTSVIEAMRAASLAGAELLVVHDHTPEQPGSRKYLVKSLQQLAPSCEKYKVKLALETLIPGYNASSLEFLLEAIEEINSPWLGICIDTNHLNLSYSLTDGVRRTGERLFECHLNDNHGKKEEHLVPFNGTIDWKSFMTSLDDINFRGNLIMEPSPRPGETYHELLNKASAARDKLLAKTHIFSASGVV